jgi:hypothetical protein
VGGIFRLFAQSLASLLFGTLHPMPNTTRNLNGQTKTQLAGEHHNLSAMVSFMRHEIS